MEKKPAFYVNKISTSLSLKRMFTRALNLPAWTKHHVFIVLQCSGGRTRSRSARGRDSKSPSTSFERFWKDSLYVLRWCEVTTRGVTQNRWGPRARPCAVSQLEIIRSSDIISMHINMMSVPYSEKEANEPHHHNIRIRPTGFNTSCHIVGGEWPVTRTIT
jgi:hypothetical protein